MLVEGAVDELLSVEEGGSSPIRAGIHCTRLLNLARHACRQEQRCDFVRLSGGAGVCVPLRAAGLPVCRLAPTNRLLISPEGGRFQGCSKADL